MEKEIVMSKKHYRDYTKPEAPVEETVVEETIAEPVEEFIAEEAEAEEPIEEPVKAEDTIEEPVSDPIRTLYTANTFADEYKEGEIVCTKLNVRKAPEKGDNVIGVFSKGTKVKIIEDLGDWLSIELSKHGNKIRGFAMKEFIK